KASCEAVDAGAYAFVSTISVYSDETPDENTRTIPLPDGADLNAVTAETDGPLKVMCEQEVAKRFPGSNVIVRAGLQMGPNDQKERFNDWTQRSIPSECL